MALFEIFLAYNVVHSKFNINTKFFVFISINVINFILCAGYQFLFYYKITYTLSAQRAIYDFNFFWRERKEILLVNVKDIELKVSFLQRLFDLGDIVLSTQAQVDASNMIIKDVKYSDEIYNLLKKDVAKAQDKSLCSNMSSI